MLTTLIDHGTYHCIMQAFAIINAQLLKYIYSLTDKESYARSNMPINKLKTT